MIDLRPQICAMIGGLSLLIGVAALGWGYWIGVSSIYAQVQENYGREGARAPDLRSYARTRFTDKLCRDAYALTPWKAMPAWQRALAATALFWGAAFAVVGSSWKPALEAANRARLEGLGQNSVPDQSARTPSAVARRPRPTTKARAV